MSDEHRDDFADRGRFGPSRTRKMGLTEIGALVFAVVWILVCALYFFAFGGTEAGGERDGMGFILVVASVIVPIAVVWLAVSAARSARIVSDESDRLQASMSAMRKVLIEVQEFQSLGAPRPEERTPRLEDATAGQLETDEPPAMFSSSRPHGDVMPTDAEPAAPETPAEPPMRDVSPETTPPAETTAPAETEPAPAPADAQPSLKFDTPQGTSGPVSADDLIRAINFPENAEDEAGFEALRRALVDRKVATLIQAAQDVLTLLSQDGIYMDDLKPDPAAAEVWRRFSGGQRGSEVAALGGIHDRSSLALSSGRMKTDAIFRDSSLHFLRRFDEVLTDFEPRMSNEQLARFATTRTARAFMLLGRVAGTFD